MSRSDAIRAVEDGVAEAGLGAVLQAYLASTFDAPSLHVLDDAQLGRALLFVAQMVRQAPQPYVPWPSAPFKGEVLWMKVDVGAAGG